VFTISRGDCKSKGQLPGTKAYELWFQSWAFSGRPPAKTAKKKSLALIGSVPPEKNGGAKAPGQNFWGAVGGPH